MAKTLAIFAILAAVTVNAADRGPASAGNREAEEIPVYVGGDAAVPPALLGQAESGAELIFERIGVRLVWKRGKRGGPARCPSGVTLRIDGVAPDSIRDGILAQTQPSTRSITVFYNRVEPLTRGWAALAPALLSNIFAHEIAHALQSMGRHSDSGILKTRWTHDDFDMMISHRLAFTPVDTALIHAGIEGSCKSVQHQGD